MSLVLKSGGVLAVASGNFTTVTASDTVVTGLREVLGAVCTLTSDPVAAVSFASVAIPDQIANPGTLTVKTWKLTATADTAPIAATTFSKVVTWLAWGK